MIVQMNIRVGRATARINLASVIEHEGGITGPLHNLNIKEGV
tara:strand:- start:976 stop:1101 length:126 start_codon:yes stop_codon:yes gene_type:complete